jgi:small subunit ribosomal protein S21
MPVVRIRDNESFENALKKFKKQCEKEGILSEIKKKPSVKKKKKAIAARKRAVKRRRFASR